MKATDYAHALMHLIKEGKEPKEAVKKLHGVLEKEGRTALMPSIGRAFERIAAQEARKSRSTLMIARKSDEAKARKESGAGGAEVEIDHTLIGGWRLEEGETLQDASWKRHLLAIYHNTTHA